MSKRAQLHEQGWVPGRGLAVGRRPSCRVAHAAAGKAGSSGALAAASAASDAGWLAMRGAHLGSYPPGDGKALFSGLHPRALAAKACKHAALAALFWADEELSSQLEAARARGGDGLTPAAAARVRRLPPLPAGDLTASALAGWTLRVLYRPLVREILVETTERGIEAAVGAILADDEHAPLRAAMVRGA